MSKLNEMVPYLEGQIKEVKVNKLEGQSSGKLKPSYSSVVANGSSVSYKNNNLMRYRPMAARPVQFRSN